MQQVVVGLTKPLFLKPRHPMPLRVMEMTLLWLRYFCPGPRIQLRYIRTPKLSTLNTVLAIGLVFSTGIPKLRDCPSYSLKSTMLPPVLVVTSLIGKKMRKPIWML